MPEAQNVVPGWCLGAFGARCLEQIVKFDRQTMSVWGRKLAPSEVMTLTVAITCPRPHHHGPVLLARIRRPPLCMCDINVTF